MSPCRRGAGGGPARCRSGRRSRLSRGNGRLRLNGFGFNGLGFNGLGYSGFGYNGLGSRLLCRALRGGGLLGGFLRCGRLLFLGRFLGRFLRRFLRGFLARLLRRFLLRRHQTLLGLFSLLASLLLFAFSHRDPPVAADQCLSSVSSRPPQAQGPTISSVPAGDRLSPNREAQPCAPQELTCRRQSAPCIQYCPRQSCPA